jgi:hypothetical protein
LTISPLLKTDVFVAKIGILRTAQKQAVKALERVKYANIQSLGRMVRTSLQKEIKNNVPKETFKLC